MHRNGVSTHGWSLGLWLAAAVCVCAVVLFVLAWNMFPVPDGDSVAFMPAIRSYAVDGRVENKTVDLSYATDPEGLGRCLFYPPVYMVVVGGVARCLGVTGYPGILLVLAAMRVASVAIFAAGLHRLARRRPAAIPPEVVVVAVALVVSNGLFLLASNGRPEVLTLLLASVAVPVSLAPARWRDVVLPLLVAVTFSFSLANGVIAFAIYAIHLCFSQESCTRRLAQLTATGTLMVVLFLGGYLLAGIDPRDGLAGFRLHSKMALSRTDTSADLLVSYWKSWCLFFFVACGFVVDQLRHRLTRGCTACTRVQTAGAVLLFGAAVLFFGVRVAPAHYNVYAFLPIYQAVAFAGFMAWATRADSAAAGEMRATGRGSRAGLSVCLGVLMVAACLACTNTAFRLLAFPYYLGSGCDYRSMKPVFARVLAEHPGTFFYSGGLQMLDDDRSGSIVMGTANGRCTSLRAKAEGRDAGRALVFIEERNGFPVPAHLRTVVLDAKDKGPPPAQLRGLRILRSRQGYSFTAFEQEPVESAPARRPESDSASPGQQERRPSLQAQGQ